MGLYLRVITPFATIMPTLRVSYRNAKNWSNKYCF
jgi:hypothetical protein